MQVGVLALQGGFDAHARAVAALGHAPVLVRSARDLAHAQALVLPGGESTVMLDLLGRDPMLEHAIVDLVEGGAPVLATCAGLILMARRVHGQPGASASRTRLDGVGPPEAGTPAGPEQRSLGLLDVEVRRNARGRQVHSCETRDDRGVLPLMLIRAPRIVAVADGVEVLATLGGEPVLVRQGRRVGATFHPELTSDLSVHALALEPHRARVSTSGAPRGSSSTTGPSTADTIVSGVANASR